MSTLTARRTFLQQAAATGLVLGLPWHAAQAKDREAGGPQGLVGVACARMRQRHVLGVAIVVPAAGPARQTRLRELAALLGGPAGGDGATPLDRKRGRGGPAPAAPVVAAEVMRVLRRAVFVCLPAAEVERVFGSAAAAKAGAVVFDASGKALELVPAAADLYGKGFAARVGAALDGKDGARLAATAAAQRAALAAADAAAIDLALSRLGSTQFARREAATRVLTKHAAWASAILLMAHATSDSLEVKSRIDQALIGGGPGAAAAPLPYGVRWKQAYRDPCPACGRGSAPAAVRRFLELVGQGKPGRKQ